MLYDLSLIRSMSGGDEAFVKEMVGVFVRQYGEIKEAMHSAEASGNYQEVGRLAHKLKGSIDTMGIQNLKGLIREIEQAGKDGLPTAEKSVHLHNEMEQVLVELNTFL